MYVCSFPGRISVRIKYLLMHIGKKSWSTRKMVMYTRIKTDFQKVNKLIDLEDQAWKKRVFVSKTMVTIMNKGHISHYNPWYEPRSFTT